MVRFGVMTPVYKIEQYLNFEKIVICDNGKGRCC